MKIEQLTAAFRKLAALEPLVEQPETRPGAAGSDHAAEPEHSTAAPRDTITLSTEAVFRFASTEFNPRRLTDEQIRELAALLHDGGAISARDRDMLISGTTRQHDTEPIAAGSDATYDGIARFQDRLARAIGRSDIAAVEANGRVLAILGRIESLRNEAP